MSVNDSRRNIGGRPTRTGAASRRAFLQKTALCAAGLTYAASAYALAPALAAEPVRRTKISGHLWVYASPFPRPHDATPVLQKAFEDLHLAGCDGIELMEVVLRHDDAVQHLSELARTYRLPVTGSSFGAPLWDSTKHSAILADATIVIKRLGELKASTLGVSVGDAGRPKTDAELDAQVVMLKKLSGLCTDAGLTLNLHNHTYEVDNGMHDLKGTLARFPEVRLGPDLNWLIRGGVDPVAFINTYGSQIVYLHIRDQDKNGQWTEYVGQGVTDFAAIAQALRNKGFKGTAAVELAFPEHYVPMLPLAEDWRRSVSYVRQTFGW